MFRGERPQEGTAAVGEQELVSVPGGDLEIPGPWHEEPDAGGRRRDGESGQVGPGEDDPPQMRAEVGHTSYGGAPKRGWLAAKRRGCGLGHGAILP